MWLPRKRTDLPETWTKQSKGRSSVKKNRRKTGLTSLVPLRLYADAGAALLSASPVGSAQRLEPDLLVRQLQKREARRTINGAPPCFYRFSRYGAGAILANKPAFSCVGPIKPAVMYSVSGSALTAV
jgi:hypothetical protein